MERSRKKMEKLWGQQKLENHKYSSSHTHLLCGWQRKMSRSTNHCQSHTQNRSIRNITVVTTLWDLSPQDATSRAQQCHQGWQIVIMNWTAGLEPSQPPLPHLDSSSNHFSSQHYVYISCSKAMCSTFEQVKKNMTAQKESNKNTLQRENCTCCFAYFIYLFIFTAVKLIT